jgi:hypothetical protein|nr:MAG TPA: hypothetical protein [Caudoviricetes sp.]
MSNFIASEADASKITYEKSEGDGPGTITIPKNVSVGTLTVNSGAHVRVDGSLNELTGNPGIVDGQGVINNVRGADCYSIEGNLYVTLIDKSEVTWRVACGTVEEIRGSTVASIEQATRVRLVVDSRVDLLTGAATVRQVEDSIVFTAYGQSRISVLGDDAVVVHLSGSAVISRATGGALVNLADGRSTVRYLSGTVQSARGAALVLSGPGGCVKHMTGSATVVQTGANLDGSTPSHSDAYVPDGDGILAYKATGLDGVSGQQSEHATAWVPGTTVRSHEWSFGDDGPGLYLSPTIADAINWSPGSGERRFFLCRIKQEDAVFIDEGRVKTPRARVIAEVDGRGNPLEPVD